MLERAGIVEVIAPVQEPATGPRIAVVVVATIAASLAFAAAHHIGPYGETFDRHAFVFRSLAGFYFTILYRLRGFGIAVGAHACYNVMVSVGAS